MDKSDSTAKKSFPLSLSDAANLMGRQSVRATFRLSAEFIDAIRALSTQLGIKQKSLFDHLMEDMETLQAVAENMHTAPTDKKERIQKTFVISKRSLTCLDAVSRDSSASRDDLVEQSIQRLLPILLEEQKKQQQREAAMEKIAKHFEQSVALHDEILQMLGEDDPIYKDLTAVFARYGDTIEEMTHVVANGKKITDLPMEKFEK